MLGTNAVRTREEREGKMDKMFENGFLNIRKPRGVTSFDAVKIVLHEILEGKRPEKRVKLGHAGTLDPLADGVLVMALNRASRLIERVQNQKKTYAAEFRLGLSSPSEDTETEMTPCENPIEPSREDIERILPEFTGEILQTPPIYSALKVNGKKAYDLARHGKPVELQPRKIVVYSLEIVSYEYPELRMKIVCGSGTYVRSLGRDLARRLGTEAVMSALTRTAIGVFRLEDALEIRPRDIETPELTRGKCTEFLRPMFDAVPDLPKIVYDAENLYRLRNGLTVNWEGCGVGEEFVVTNASGDFLAIVRGTERGKLRSVLNFSNDFKD